MTRRDPVDRVVEFVVAVPRSFLAVARELMPFDTGGLERRVGAVVRRNRALITRGAVRGVAAGVPVRRPGGPVVAEHDDVRTAPVTDHPVSAVADDVPGDPADVGPADAHPELPIDGYDQLSARQIVDRLPALSADERDAVEAYERRHRRRQTVLGRIEQLA